MSSLCFLFVELVWLFENDRGVFFKFSIGDVKDAGVLRGKGVANVSLHAFQPFKCM
jgi:hypothetical protein